MSRGYGYIFGPAHGMITNIPVKNSRAFTHVSRNQTCFTRRWAFVWPHILELNINQPAQAPTAKGPRQVVVLDVEHDYQPDLWSTDNPARKAISAARVRVNVSGEIATLVARPYTLPTVVNGVRLYVEATRAWAHEVAHAPLTEITTDVRLSALDAAQPWGPEEMVFPIRDYRWRSSSYNNTWSSLVPHNVFYYHRGDDFGAIPDRLDVVAAMSGAVTVSPLPHGDGKSNGLIVSAGDSNWRYAHMNTESIEPSLIPGSSVRAGQKLGRTGCTWSGKRSQRLDPHLHLGLERNGDCISTYPFLVRAYLNTYPDSALAVAGGWAYAMPGEAVMLDATRSIARPGRRIVSTRWKLHDGRTLDAPLGAMTFDRPGLYSEELNIKADDGYEARDFLQVRVFDPRRERDMATGFAYHTPVRGIRPGTPVLFWNRLYNTSSPVEIDFGDGTPPQRIEEEIEHAFARAGIYSVAFAATMPGDDPVVVKLPVVVESCDDAAMRP